MPIIRHQDLAKKEGSSPGLEVRLLVDEEQGSHSLRVGELTIAPKSRVPRHIHPNAEEAMIILEGTLDAILGNQRMTVGPGHTVVAPAGAVHGFLNRYEEPARLLFVFPSHEVESVLSNAPREKVGFASEKGLMGYESPEDRPLSERS